MKFKTNNIMKILPNTRPFITTSLVIIIYNSIIGSHAQLDLSNSTTFTSTASPAPETTLPFCLYEQSQEYVISAAQETGYTQQTSPRILPLLATTRSPSTTSSSDGILTVNDNCFLVFWVARTDGSGLGVVGQIWKSNSSFLAPDSPVFQVNSIIDLDQINPTAVNLSNNGIMIAWESMVASKPEEEAILNRQRRIKFQIFDGNAFKIGFENSVNDDIDLGIRLDERPWAASMFSSVYGSRFIIVWKQTRFDGTSVQPDGTTTTTNPIVYIKARMFYPDGIPLTSDITIASAVGDLSDTSMDFSPDYPQVTALNGGEYCLITWQQPTAFGTLIMGQKIRADGLLFQAKFVISSLGSMDVNVRAKAVELSDLTTSVAWTRMKDSAESNIQYRLYDQLGSEMEMYQLINNAAESTPLPGGQMRSDVSMGSFMASGWMDQGQFILSWNTLVNDRFAVESQVFYNNGTEKDAKVRLSPEELVDNDTLPDVAVLPNNEIIVVWNRNGNEIIAKQITCQRDCVVIWSDFGECSVPCGGGFKMRSRIKVMDKVLGGRDCEDLESVQYFPCNPQPCPV